MSAIKTVHEYDIRGLYPGELTPELFTRIGIALVYKYSPQVVAVGHDVRESSPLLADALIAGIRSTGCTVYQLGLVSTEIGNFVTGYYPEVHIAAIVTASHNPKEYNGLKVVGDNAEPISEHNGLLELVKMAEKLDLPAELLPKGELISFDGFWHDYRRFLYDHSKIDELANHFSVVIDPGNGAGGYAYEQVFGTLLSITPHLINAFPNGEFPFHEANPAHTETLAQLSEYMRTEKHKVDFGVAFDADADRIVFLDKKGDLMHPYYLGVLLAEYFLRTSHQPILHDSRLRLAFNDLSKRYPGRVIVNKPGRSNYYQNIKDKNASFAMEASGHYFYSDFFAADSAFMTYAHMTHLIDSGLNLHRTHQNLAAKYVLSGEVNYTVADADNLIADFITKYRKLNPQSVTTVDGIEVTYPDWAMSLRKSNTQPLVRLNVEARSKESLIKNFREIEAMINSPRENAPILPELV